MPIGVYNHSVRLKQICKRGHDTSITGRDNIDRCIECRRFTSRQYENKNKEKVNIQKRNISWKLQNILNKDGKFFRMDDYIVAFKEQNGKCKICSVPKAKLKNAFCVDHDHASGLFRGLLCITCNLRVGIIEDKRFKPILNYLKGFNKIIQ